MNVVRGYAAINLGEAGWRGVIEGDVPCDQFRKDSDEALVDAKELYNSFADAKELND